MKIEQKKEQVLKVEKDSELEITFRYLVEFSSTYIEEIKIGILVLFIYALSVIAPHIVSLFVVSYFVALICNPILNLLEKKRVSRPLGIIVIALVFLAFIFLLFGFLIPVIVSEYSGLIGEVPELSSRAYVSIKLALEKSLKIKLSFTQERIREFVATIVPNISSDNIKLVLYKLGSTLFAGYSASLSLLNAFILPLLIFYLAKDWKEVNQFFLSITPKSYQIGLRKSAKDVEVILNSFARGQLLVAFALMCMYSLALFLIGLPYAIPIGIVAGALGVIPYVGLAIGIILSLLVQGAYDPTFYGFIKVVAAFLVVQAVDGNFVTPRIVGDSMGLHPAVVIVALLIGGSALGLIGLLLAIPGAALVKLVFEKYFKTESFI